MLYIKNKLFITALLIAPVMAVGSNNVSNENNEKPKSFFENLATKTKEAVEDERYKESIKNISSTSKNKANNRVETGFIEQQEEKLKQYKEQLQKAGMLDGFDEASISIQTKKHEDAAKLIASQSQTGMQNALAKELGLVPDDVKQFNPTELDNPLRQKAIFISFSMADSGIEAAMRTATKDSATLFLKGMHPNDSGIQDTIKRLQIIGRKLDVKPDVRFKPRLFDEYNITAVPTSLVKDGDKVAYASGLTNLSWLSSKVKKDETGFLGFYGDTMAVIEKDIRIEIKERFANYDFKDKRKKVVDNFWKKQTFNALPPAQKNDSWYIDITVKAKADIINPRGDKLATAGQVISPMSNMATPLTLVVFDPLDGRQVEWASNHVHNVDYSGDIMVMFSRIDVVNGWDHLAALREHFGRELYKLPKELIHRFNIESLPVVISSDMDKQLMRVEQFDVRGEEK